MYEYFHGGWLTKVWPRSEDRRLREAGAMFHRCEGTQIITYPPTEIDRIKEAAKKIPGWKFKLASLKEKHDPKFRFFRRCWFKAKRFFRFRQVVSLFEAIWWWGFGPRKLEERIAWSLLRVRLNIRVKQSPLLFPVIMWIDFEGEKIFEEQGFTVARDAFSEKVRSVAEQIDSRGKIIV